MSKWFIKWCVTHYWWDTSCAEKRRFFFTLKEIHCLQVTKKSTQRHWISWTERVCANPFSSSVITHVLSVKWLGHWKLCLQIPRSPQCFWTCCVAAFPVTLLKKEFNSVLCLMRMIVSPNLDHSLWLTTSISLSFHFMFKVYLWLPY